MTFISRRGLEISGTRDTIDDVLGKMKSSIDGVALFFDVDESDPKNQEIFNIQAKNAYVAKWRLVFSQLKDRLMENFQDNLTPNLQIELRRDQQDQLNILYRSSERVNENELKRIDLKVSKYVEWAKQFGCKVTDINYISGEVKEL